MSKTLTDLNRNELVFHQPVINPALPEYFQDQYPVFVTLLDKYYDWLVEYTDEGNRKPIGELQDISYLKDREVSPDRFLQYIFDELASGLAPDNFDIPRFIIKLMPFFYKTKGSTVSAQGFLKFLYGTDIELVYPKKQTFTIGASEIGAESLKYIQDSYFYQIYSTLIRSDLPISVWKELYKKFVHPAGWELFAEVRFESVTTNTTLPAAMPIAALGAGAEIFTISGITNNLSINAVSGEANVTVVDDNEGIRIYGDFGSRGLFDYYAESDGVLALAPYNNNYVTLAQPLQVSSFKFSMDDDTTYINFNLSDSGTYFMDGDDVTLDTLPVIKGISFDNTIETFDETTFDYISPTGVDSA
jgi:hypothetical protein